MPHPHPYNPFVVGQYVGPEYFCDREEATSLLGKQMLNGRNVALISPRRMGKTGLIKHYFNREETTQTFHPVFVDIYTTSTLQEMVCLLGKALFEAIPKKSISMVRRFFDVVRSFHLGFKIDSMSGSPSLDISVGAIEQPETSLDEIFAYIDSLRKPVIVAIDEFQKIGCYRDTTDVEAQLRSKIQHSTNSRFIFAGSERHIMEEMFLSPSRPFYQSVVTMSLDPLDKDVYVDFGCRMFGKFNRKVEREAMERVYDTAHGFTWYMQMLANEMFAITDPGQTCSSEMVDDALQNIIAMQSETYRSIMASLSERQRRLITAISANHTVTNPMSAEFVQSHSLNSSSSVQAALKSLLSLDMVTRDASGAVRVYDVFFDSWIRAGGSV